MTDKMQTCKTVIYFEPQVALVEFVVVFVHKLVDTVSQATGDFFESASKFDPPLDPSLYMFGPAWNFVDS
jgi:hypothetical protein